MLIEIEGAGTFRLMERRTIECDIYLSNLLRAAGAEAALIEALSVNEEPDSRIFQAVAASGKLFDILAGALVPEGVDALDWSPGLARDTAEKLKRVTSEAGKRALLSAVVPLVTGFFLLGLRSLATSRKSSLSPGSRAQPDSGSGATTTMATGGSWFGSLRTSIRNALGRSSNGP